MGEEDDQQADRDDRQRGPYCQVEIRTLRARTSGAAFISSSEAATDQGEGVDLLFVERELLVRSYNSVSLSDDGTYSLTLSDCYGFMPITTSSSLARRVSSASWQSRNHDGGDAGRRERHTAEIVRLLFLPLPSSIKFEVNSGQATSSGAVIGNFHLLPVAHVPQQQHAPVFNAETTITSPGIRTAGHANYTPQVPVLHESSRPYLFSATAAADDSLCERGETDCTGEGPGIDEGTALSSIGGGFARGVTEDGVPHGVDAPGKSNDGSSDSDETVIENVPEPVGLPRSEEDWRVLFDTLYED